MACDLLAIDLDGTLLDTRHRLPAENRDALHRAHAAGLKIVLCTGRAFTETRQILEDIGLDLDATVTVFGALVSDARSGETLFRSPFPPDVAAAATAWFRSLGYPVMWLNDPNEIGFDGYVINGPRRHEAVGRWIAWSACTVREVDELPDEAAPPLRLSVIDDGPELEAVSTRLRQAFDGRLTHNVLHAPPYSLSLIEAFAVGVNKWSGIEKLCRRWGIDPSRTVAVGDDVNDIDMLRCAGLGVAMANAKPPVIDVADRVTASNDELGVAKLIHELLDAQAGTRP